MASSTYEPHEAGRTLQGEPFTLTTAYLVVGDRRYQLTEIATARARPESPYGLAGALIGGFGLFVILVVGLLAIPRFAAGTIEAIPILVALGSLIMVGGGIFLILQERAGIWLLDLVLRGGESLSLRFRDRQQAGRAAALVRQSMAAPGRTAGSRTGAIHTRASPASQAAPAVGGARPLAPSSLARPAVSTDPGATRPCPYCAETIRSAARVCRFCGRDLGPSPRFAGTSLAAGRVLILAGAAAMIAGALLPWASVEILGSATTALGVQGDGLITGLIGFLILIGASIEIEPPRKAFVVIGMVSALFAGVVATNRLGAIAGLHDSDKSSKMSGLAALVATGPGLYVTLVGVALVLVGLLLPLAVEFARRRTA